MFSVNDCDDEEQSLKKTTVMTMMTALSVPTIVIKVLKSIK